MLAQAPIKRCHFIAQVIIEEKKRGCSTKTKSYQSRQGEAAQPSSFEASTVD
jgi:hypothetical protein